MRYLALLPEAVVALLAGLCLAAGPSGPLRLRVRGRRAVPVVVSTGLLLALALELTLGSAVSGGPYGQDRLALFGKAATLLALGLGVAVTDWDLEAVGTRGWRPLGLALLAGLGVMAVASAGGLVVLGVGLAIAIPAVAFGIALGEPAALRGRLIAAAAGALLLTVAGLLVVFVASGQSDLAAIARTLSGHVASVAVAGGVLLVILGLGLTLVAAPWGHAQRPAATPFGLGAAFGLGTLAAGLAMVKVVGAAAVSFPGWAPALQVGAAVVLVAGAFGALGAARLGRLLGWLGMVQAGWFLAALSTHYRQGLGAALFVLAALAVAGAVGPQLIAASEAGSGLAGLAGRHPWRAASLSAALLSLAGAPPLVGFFAEFSVAASLARTGGFWVLAVGLLASMMALLAAVRVLRRLFLDAPPEEVRRAAPPQLTVAGLAVAGSWLAALVVAAWGLLAYPTLDLAVQAAAALGVR